MELEQKIARGALGGGGEPGDLCKKSLLPNKSMGSQGGELEKLAGGDEEYMDSPSSRREMTIRDKASESRHEQRG